MILRSLAVKGSPGDLFLAKTGVGGEGLLIPWWECCVVGTTQYSG